MVDPPTRRTRVFIRTVDDATSDALRFIVHLYGFIPLIGSYAGDSLAEEKAMQFVDEPVSAERSNAAATLADIETLLHAQIARAHLLIIDLRHIPSPFRHAIRTAIYAGRHTLCIVEHDMSAALPISMGEISNHPRFGLVSYTEPAELPELVTTYLLAQNLLPATIDFDAMRALECASV